MRALRGKGPHPRASARRPPRVAYDEAMTASATLRALLSGPGLVQAPGAYDAHSARLIERAGFRVAYMTGFGASASRLGVPDTGLLSGKESTDHAAALAAALRIPLVADANTGYGNVANVQRTVRTLARAGVAGVQIEDQEWPKRCGHTAGKRVVSRGEAAARIRAAVDARDRDGAGDIVVVARTDARAVHGFDDALDRCRAFEDAGADVVFLEAPASEDEMERACAAVSRPMLVNVLEGGATPVLSPQAYEALGFRMAIYPLTLLYVVTAAIQEHLASGGAFAPWRGPLGFDELRALVGFPAYDALVRHYAPREDAAEPPPRG